MVELMAHLSGKRVDLVDIAMVVEHGGRVSRVLGGPQLERHGVAVHCRPALLVIFQTG